MSENKNKIWGGRFEHNPSGILEKINSSIQFDKRLYKHDILASIAHTEMLKKQIQYTLLRTSHFLSKNLIFGKMS